MPPAFYYQSLGRSYLLAGQYDKAIAELEKGLQVAPNHAGCLLALAATYSIAGREKEARRTVSELLRVNPKFSLGHFEKSIHTKDPAVKKRFMDALRKAGLK
jgi:tetratricopeptide (TPR) repeat protein